MEEMRDNSLPGEENILLLEGIRRGIERGVCESIAED
jgi:hypothetical protein